MIRIVIVDDHPIVRRGLRHIIESDAEIEIIGEAASAEEIWSAPLVSCDVLVLDLAIPGAVGMSVLKELKHRYPTLPILILSIAPEEQFAIRALREGASGYVMKRSVPEQLVDAIRSVVEGRIYASPSVGRVLAADLRRPALSRNAAPSRLSDREIEVLRLFASGMSLTAIAARLNISIKTISTYRRRTLAKLHLESNAALIRYAIEEHLVES